MSVIYEQCEDDVHDLAREIVATHHLDLQDRPGQPGTGIRFCILMASQEDSESNDPPLKIRGYPKAAIVAIIPYKQRVDKRADAEILIDKDQWADLNDRQRRALLDHEITHLQVVRDDKKFVKTDDLGRPKLEMKLHDFDFGGFRSIAQRYGPDALEVMAARNFEQEYGQDVLGRETLPFGKAVEV